MAAFGSSFSGHVAISRPNTFDADFCESICLASSNRIESPNHIPRKYLRFRCPSARSFFGSQFASLPRSHRRIFETHSIQSSAVDFSAATEERDVGGSAESYPVSVCGVPLDKSTTVCHFIGIGGIGMSGIAEVLAHRGFVVRGSDMADSSNVQRLRAAGASVTVGHSPSNISDDISIVVLSSAIKESNSELAEARRRGLNIVHRADMLGGIMSLVAGAHQDSNGSGNGNGGQVAIAGTHGKTTTTSLMATLFDEAGRDATVLNGGIINAYGSNARVGDGHWVVVEADESDGTFVRLPVTIGIVTNMDAEHMDHYGHFDAVQEAYTRFVVQALSKPGGFAVLCIDHPVVHEMYLALISHPTYQNKIISYGFSDDADVRASREISYDSDNRAVFNVLVHCRGPLSDVSPSAHDDGDGMGPVKSLEAIKLNLLGEHNVLNSLAIVAVGLALNMGEDVVRRALSSFQGVQRRFTKVGEVRGVSVIDDYGHHPVEIAAVLRAARSSMIARRQNGGTLGKIVAVHQPHRYSRLANLFEDFAACFDDADVLILSPVYPAGEAPIPGADHALLKEAISKRGDAGPRTVVLVEGAGDLPRAIVDSVGVTSGDMVVCLGAGSISAWARALPEQLAAYWDSRDAS
mmetsp:Transcript_83/g.141  ORF Transcript_83/g.141 Transcript_83/m.141 type:complete len:635 (+) Transcript_83:153-2057(+)